MSHLDGKSLEPQFCASVMTLAKSSPVQANPRPFSSDQPGGVCFFGRTGDGLMAMRLMVKAFLLFFFYHQTLR